MEASMNVRWVSITAAALIAQVLTLPAVAAPISYSFATVDYPSAYST
jgi:hypothetical protein